MKRELTSEPDFIDCLPESNAEPSDAVNQDGFAIENLPGLFEAQAAIQFLIEPELPFGSVVAFTGDSASGKSTLATALARDAIIRDYPVLVLDRDNPPSILRDRGERLGLSDGPLLRVWHGGLSHEVPELSSPIVYQWVASCVPQPLVIVDSVIAFYKGDENSSADMRRFMAGPRRLAHLGACVILIHHDGKSETARYFRGSSDFKAAIDQGFHVANSSADSSRKLDRLHLRCFKSRYGFSGDLWYRYAGGCMVREDRPEVSERTLADQFRALLEQHPAISKKEFEDLATKEGLGRNRARAFLANGVQCQRIDFKQTGRNRQSYTLKCSPE